MIRRSTWIALGLFGLVLLGAVIWTRQSDEELDREATPTAEALWELEAAEILALSIADLDSNAEVAARRHPERGWELDSPPGAIANAGSIERTATSLMVLRPRSTLSADDLAPYGLSPAGFRLHLQLADGTSRVLLIGREAPTGGVRYAALPQSSEVLLLSSFSLQDVIGWLEQPPLATPMQDPTETSE